LRVADAGVSDGAGAVAAPSDPASPEGRLMAKVRAMAARFAADGPPDPADASLAELLAWCLALGRDGAPPAGAG